MTSKRALNIGDIASAWLRDVSLEELLTHPMLFGLASASPLQRAICRIADGMPLEELETDATVREALGGTTDVPARPKELAIVAGIRTYKSGLAACMCTQAALQCDATGLQPGEQLRASMVSTKLENAKAVYQHLAGAWKASPLLRTMLVTDPDNSSDRFTIRRPDGVLCEFLTVAGSRAGSGLTSFWQAAVVFDEYARMVGNEADGVINWSEQRKAVVQRIRKGGYLVHISSPWAPFGPAYRHVTESHGKPTPQLVVIRARADHMNPVYWTPARCEDARLADADAYKTDVLAEFTSGEESFFHVDHLTACERATDADEPRDPRAHYSATMDPATRSNGWTFGIFTRDGKTRRMVAAREWVGSRAAPLDPETVVRDHIAPLCHAYGISTIESDGWSSDALHALCRHYGVSLVAYSWTDRERAERYRNVRVMLAKGEVSLPRVTAIRDDLLRVKKKVTANGATVHLPETSDGRHCDWAPTIVQGLCRYIDDVEPPPPSPSDWGKREAQRMREAAERSLERNHDDD
jgi:hypothetical protein